MLLNLVPRAFSLPPGNEVACCFPAFQKTSACSGLETLLVTGDSRSYIDHLVGYIALVPTQTFPLEKIRKNWVRYSGLYPYRSLY